MRETGPGGSGKLEAASWVLESRGEGRPQGGVGQDQILDALGRLSRQGSPAGRLRAEEGGGRRAGNAPMLIQA